MPSDRIEPLWGEPALRLRLRQGGRPTTYLVLGELHLGIESDLARAGAFLRSRTIGLAERILNLAEASKARSLILLGDVKHRVTHLSAQERRDLPKFFSLLAAFETIHVALGNHDAGLRHIVDANKFPNVHYHPATGLLVPGDEQSVACLHGHAWPRPALLEASTFLVGHTHAAAALVDQTGRGTTEWAWLRGRLDPEAVRAKYGRTSRAQVIVFPPFNPLCAGVAINREGLLGPFRKLVDLREAELHLLDGRRLAANPEMPG